MTVQEQDAAPPPLAQGEGEIIARLPKIRGEPIEKWPDDLYIPPDALEVFLDAFEGPLDLLLYLIRKQNVDILDIPVARITDQYMQYIDLMQNMRIELAADYLVMAAMLAEIKSRMLLPKPPVTEGEEGVDPRAELIRRLQEYERFKQAAEALERLPRVGREIFVAQARSERVIAPERQPQPELKELILAFREVMLRAELFAHHHIQREPLSVRERMSQILTHLQETREAEFSTLFPLDEGRMGVVVTFLAILELVKESVLQMEQPEVFGPIFLRVAGAGGSRAVAANEDLAETEDGQSAN
ncbi:MAG: segregation and condensation protein A [Nevskiales bacterium]